MAIRLNWTGISATAAIRFDRMRPTALALAISVLASGASAQPQWEAAHLAGPPINDEDAGAADGVGSQARFNYPTGIALAPDGTAYVTDHLNHTLRRVSADGVVSTLAGLAGAPGFANGMGRQARFRNPVAVAFDPTGPWIYVADGGNDAIRRVSLDGEVSTFWTGSRAMGLCVDAAGMLYMSLVTRHIVMRVTPSGVASVWVGSDGARGTADGARDVARLNFPEAIAIDAAGVLFLADTGSKTVRRIAADQSVTTIAGLAGFSGTVDGAGSAARFVLPEGIAVDAYGLIYVADRQAHIIRVIEGGNVTRTIGGLANGQFTGVEGNVDGVGANTRFSQPWGIAVSPNGARLLVADAGNHGIRELTPQDVDDDGLPTRWEVTFGLDPRSATGVDGAGGDPDGDGVSNAEELAAGTHPRAFVVRYLAEGATSSFFRTQIALANPDAGDAHVLLRFLKDGGEVTRSALVPARSRRTVAVQDVPGLASAAFSTVIDADRAVLVDRTMSWGGSGYGSHAEGAVPAPSTTWYLAEGSTSGDFALFYLLQNPNAEPVTATVRYLRALGMAPIERTYVLPPHSRTTIDVDGQGPELANGDVSGVITATAPIIAERAMYRSTPTQLFAAGHGSAGVTAPVTRWFLAEGATGPFFDLFILLANPGDMPAQVQVDYLLSTGETFAKAYTVPANGRFTIWVDDEQLPGGSGNRPLANVAVSSTITSTNDVPIIVERTMWWPSPEVGPNYWTEAHNSPGATATGTRWALAEGEIGGPQRAETYILVANTSAFSGQARVTLYFEDGASAQKVIALLPTSRASVNVSQDFPVASGRRFGALIESLGETPAQIVVERAMYTSPGGQTWAAGTNALATRLP